MVSPRPIGLCLANPSRPARGGRAKLLPPGQAWPKTHSLIWFLRHVCLAFHRRRDDRAVLVRLGREPDSGVGRRGIHHRLYGLLRG